MRAGRRMRAGGRRGPGRTSTTERSALRLLRWILRGAAAAAAAAR